MSEAGSSVRLRGPAALLGPAFVTAVAYMTREIFLTNIAAGAGHGYSLARVADGFVPVHEDLGEGCWDSPPSCSAAVRARLPDPAAAAR
jgi:hypothetical protein